MTAAAASRSSAGVETKARILEATLVTVKQEGIVGTSARAIARAGDFNQALVFYHFGSVDNAVTAAVAEMGARRIERHRIELEQATSLPDLVRIARVLHDDDTTSENMAVLAQALAGAARDDEMGPKLYSQLEPWGHMLADTIKRVLGDSPIASVIPCERIADAMSALFLGIELLDDLDPSKRHAAAMFDSLESLADLVASFLP